MPRSQRETRLALDFSSEASLAHFSAQHPVRGTEGCAQLAVMSLMQVI